MSTAKKLLDKAAAMCEGKSYAALARRLEVTPQTVHQWKNGDVPIPAARIVEMATIARVSVDDWTLLVLTEQAKGAEKPVLERVVKRLGLVASLVLCAIGFSLPMAGNAHATRNADPMASGDVQGNAYYVKADWAWWARLARWWLAWKLRGSRSTPWRPMACNAA